MALTRPTKLISRLPIKLVIDKEDLESDDEVPERVSSKKNSKGKSPRIKLASQIETGKEPIPLYIDVNPHQEKESSSEQHGGRERRSAQAAACGLSMAEKIVAEKTVLKPGFEKLERVPAYSETVKSLKIARRKEAEKTKGDKWFNLPAPEMTEEKQRDLEIIQMRSILNPKQFYKKNDLKVLPKYFQVGTVIDSAADFYHSRVPRKDRKKTLVDELMADANFQRYNKRKYADIIQSKPKVASAASKRSRQLKKKT